MKENKNSTLVEVEVSKQEWPTYFFYRKEKPKHSISDVIDWLNQVKESGATHLYFDAKANEFAINSVYLTAYYSREETQQELDDRIKKEKAEKDRVDELDRATYNALKKKFETQTNNEG